MIVIFFSLYVLNEIINVYDLSGVLSHNNAHWYSPLLCWLPEYFTINIVLSRSHKFIQRAKNSLVRVVFISLYLCWAQYHIYDQSMTKFYTIRTTKKHILLVMRNVQQSFLLSNVNCDIGHGTTSSIEHNNPAGLVHSSGQALHESGRIIQYYSSSVGTRSSPAFSTSLYSIYFKLTSFIRKERMYIIYALIRVLRAVLP